MIKKEREVEYLGQTPSHPSDILKPYNKIQAEEEDKEEDDDIEYLGKTRSYPSVRLKCC